MGIGPELKISPRLEENLGVIKAALGHGDSFDVVIKDLRFAGRDAALVLIDGLVKDDVMLRIVQFLLTLCPDGLEDMSVDRLLQQRIGYIETSTVETVKEVVDQVLAGPVGLLVDGQRLAVIIDARTYPARGPEEPDLERVLRGSRDGFTETIVFNTVLIRRRLRDPSLRFELLTIGRRSKTDVVVAYLADVTNPRLKDLVKGRIKRIDVDAVPMAEKAIEEFIGAKPWWNPFPVIRYTERPDVAAAHLLEGHVVVLVDTSPSAVIVPATLFQHLQHAEEYRQEVMVGSYLRLVRFAAVLIAWFGPPLWVLLATQKGNLPESLRFIGPRKPGSIPLFLQFVLGEVGVDMIRLALIHTPDALATSLGFIGAILLGQVAVSVGFFANETILYVALAALGTFATPSMELALAIRLMRLTLLLLVGLFRLPGLVAGLVIQAILLLSTRSFGVPYLWPLVPLEGRALKNMIFRLPVPERGPRPGILEPQERERQRKR